MLKVIQTAMTPADLARLKGQPVMDARPLTAGLDNLSHIRQVAAAACAAAEAGGFTSLLLPVINTRKQETAAATVAPLLVSEVRRYLSLGSRLAEVTFVLPDQRWLEAFQQAAGRQKIVCLGDSITYGYPEGPDSSWVNLAAAATGYRFINRGVNGDTTGQMLARFARDVAEETPAYVILAGGHNDGWLGVPLSEVAANISSLVDQSFEHGICPLLVLPSPLHLEQMLRHYPGSRRAAVAYCHRLEQIRRWLGRYAAARGLLTIDFYTPLLDNGTGQADTKYLLDGGHPTRQGYRMLADAVVNRLKGRLHFTQ
ncbi:SGNH/GDSL hydrolase family protein [Desulforamulus hydrothermalis]|uniref:Lipolytic protein G-D-S-L family n=1 Tax=Desulforamulus hydrothermalis Lam5 = DSM 18033 TaxID=1121428 RepID=K8E0V8_9FIRM|nr:SGNH/GDSL hydrolase family protein [Desulforamulus hydrothermalis]CCO09284.1 Lipolytic protein G-D-S-L family [Desulforamulus hydrothermalis Lam5 = DSM 18033]SHH04942.1 Lysophospholipase L1 [Desulforamulus hydrothermalis Lam5 = DSM 18033]